MPSVKIIAVLGGGAAALVAALLVAQAISSPSASPAGVPAATLVSDAAPSAPVAGRAPRFVEEAAAAGIEHAYGGEFEYFVGGGVSVFDCDEDELPDLYFAGGNERAALFRNASAAGDQLRFEPIAGLETDLDAVTGAYPLDVDGDGVTDLAILRRGENVLLRGLGECRFERANETWSFDGGADWTTAFSARWDAGRAWPTVAIGNYLAPDDGDSALLCSA